MRIYTLLLLVFLSASLCHCQTDDPDGGGEPDSQDPPDEAAGDGGAAAPTEAAKTDAPAEPAAAAATEAPAAQETTEAKEEDPTEQPTEKRGDGQPPLPPAATAVPKQETTQAKEEPTTEGEAVTTAEPTPAIVVDLEEPCDTPNLLTDDRRHFSEELGKKQEPLCDADIVDAWYRFKYEGDDAVITTVAIKEGQCGTQIPYHLRYVDRPAPDVNETASAELCGSLLSKYGMLSCIEPVTVKVKNCDSHMVYKLAGIELDTVEARGSICVQKARETVPTAYLARQPEEEPPTESNLPIIPVEECTDAQIDGTITLEMTGTSSNPEVVYKQFSDSDLVFREKLVSILNNLPPPTDPVPSEEATTEGGPKTGESKESDTETIVVSEDDLKKGEDVDAPEQIGPVVPDTDADADPKGPGARRKRAAEQQKTYTADDVHYVGPTPRSHEGGLLQVAVFVDEDDDNPVPQDRLYEAGKQMNSTNGMKDANFTAVDVYPGLPADIEPTKSSSVWEDNKGLFITIIVLLIICLIIIIIGLCCMYCRKTRGSWTRADDRVRIDYADIEPQKKQPRKQPPTHAVESPIPDEEIVKGEAPMTEAPNPSYPANGGHISKKDEDNGWVVPIDEMKGVRTATEDTKL